MSPNPALGRRSNGSIECAAFPAKNARARSVEKTRRASASALEQRVAQRAKRPPLAELARQTQRRPRIERKRPEEERLDRAPALRERPDEPPVRRAVRPERSRRLVDAAHEERRLVVVERMRDARRRLEPVHVELERAEADGRPPERMDRRAHVVPKPGQRQLVGTHAAADPVGRLVHDHVEAGAGERDRRGEPVRPRTDDDRLTGRRAPRAHARRRAGTRAPPASSL